MIDVSTDVGPVEQENQALSLAHINPRPDGILIVTVKRRIQVEVVIGAERRNERKVVAATATDIDSETLTLTVSVDAIVNIPESMRVTVVELGTVNEAVTEKKMKTEVVIETETKHEAMTEIEMKN